MTHKPADKSFGNTYLSGNTSVCDFDTILSPVNSPAILSLLCRLRSFMYQGGTLGENRGYFYVSEEGF